MSGMHPMLEPFRPTAATPFDRVRAAPLLNRAGFGGTPQEIEDIVRLGPRAAVESLLGFPDEGAAGQRPPDAPDLSAVAPFTDNYRRQTQLFAAMTVKEVESHRTHHIQANHDGIVAVVRWWLDRMCRGPYPLQEKLTLFWHGHFTTSVNDAYTARLIWRQNELLRRMAAGNFRVLTRRAN